VRVRGLFNAGGEVLVLSHKFLGRGIEASTSFNGGEGEEGMPATLGAAQ
jgi:hypothetical protein